MKPSEKFLNQPKHFWANVRTISEQAGYTAKRPRRQRPGKKNKSQPELIELEEVSSKGKIHVPTLKQMRKALHEVGLSSSHISDEENRPTELGRTLSEYFEYRADVLNNTVEPLLMDASRAKELFDELKARLCPTCPLPLNKQTGEKKAAAYFTGIINMLIEASAEGLPCDYDPRSLTSVTVGGAPLRTLARRVDGAFTSVVNPIAVWEIKEYYYTTSFGSRVADGVYESLLDGMELEELREHEGVDVKHYLMIDAYDTWWKQGKSYLCRIIDMLHMGYVDEVLFGSEVVSRLPVLVKEWVSMVQRRG